MEIKNWHLVKDGIEYINGNFEYFIPTERLLENLGDNTDLYNWLVFLAEKDWVTEDNMQSFNVLFLYAVGYFKLNLDYDKYQRSLIYQSKLLSGYTED